jgi:hypothetical protein
MSTCWKCGEAPPSWARICEVCGGRGVPGSTTTLEEMEGFKRGYWRDPVGQFSHPFRSGVGFIVPSIANPLLLRV